LPRGPHSKGETDKERASQEEHCSELESTDIHGLIEAEGPLEGVAREAGNNAPPPAAYVEGKTAYLK